MSISEDYERYRKRLGRKKYNALEEYICKFGNHEEWRKGQKRLRGIEDWDEYNKEYSKLHKSCKPIFLEDVILDTKELEKFEKWYKENIEKENLKNETEEIL